MANLKYVLEEDARLDLNVSKTCILPKGISQQASCNVAQQKINSSPTLATISGNVSLASFCPEGFVGIDVPIVVDDVEKLVTFGATSRSFFFPSEIVANRVSLGSIPSGLSMTRVRGERRMRPLELWYPVSGCHTANWAPATHVESCAEAVSGFNLVSCSTV